MVDQGVLGRLCTIADLKFEVAQRDLAMCGQRIEEMKAKLNAFPKDRFDMEEGVSIQILHRADLLWRRHLEMQKREMLSQLANLRAEQESLRQLARHAFGQQQALSVIAKRKL